MTDFLVAESGIRQLHTRCADAVWRKDAGAFGDCFTEDGEWSTDYGTARGRGEIEALLASVVPRPGEGPQRKHYITNILIELAGDRADVRSDYLVVRESENGLLPVMGGTYRDTFTKQDGKWLFARKELVHDIVGDMALKNDR